MLFWLKVVGLASGRVSTFLKATLVISDYVSIQHEALQSITE